MNKNDFYLKLLTTFKVEADEHLRAIIEGLLALEKNPSEENTSSILESIHREAHSLKGASRAVELLDIDLICQSLEAVFSLWKKRELEIQNEHFDIIYNVLNKLVQYINAPDISTYKMDSNTISMLLSQLQTIKSGTIVTKQNTTNSKLDISGVADESGSSNHSTKTVRIESAKLDSILLKVEELLTIKHINHHYQHELSSLLEYVQSKKKRWQKSIQLNGSQNAETIANEALAQLKHIDHELSSLMSRFINDNRLINNQVDNLLDDTKKLIMLPCSILFNTFPIMIRNLGRDQEKSIDLILEGTDIEIDKRILDELKDPITHIIRNAIDHGIEKTSDRNKLNKPTAMIKISVSRSGTNEIVITISDNGRGINLDAVKTAAYQKNLISADALSSMDDEAALSLIYSSGVSTSPLVTEISGHGLGMAIVREKIDKIGGKISVHTSKDQGTAITLQFPQTLSVFKGILVSVSDQLYVIPATNVDRIIRVSPEDVSTLENKPMITLDGSSISLMNLANVLGISPQQHASARFPVVISSLGDNRIALQIDDVHSGQEVLVKRLDKPLEHVKFISGVTILGSGHPVPILNILDVANSISEAHFMPTTQIDINNDIPNDKEAKTSLLVVEDSITTRMLLKTILEMAGYTVMTAADGIEAWRVLQENKSLINMVISDVEMPRMNGFELVNKVRHEKDFEKLPIILVTSMESKEDREQGIDVGANAYINKSSFDNNDLLTVIKRLL